MILWLLRLFPQFRDLEVERMRLREAIQSATTEKLILQDRLDSAVEDRNKLWDLTREAINNERGAYQMQVNAEWQKRGFGAPYPDAAKLPDGAVPAAGGGTTGKPQPQPPSVRVARAMGDFIDSYRQQALKQPIDRSYGQQ